MFVVGCRVWHLGRGTAFIVHWLTWRGPLEGERVLVWALEGAGSWVYHNGGSVWWWGVLVGCSHWWRCVVGL